MVAFLAGRRCSVSFGRGFRTLILNPKRSIIQEMFCPLAKKPRTGRGRKDRQQLKTGAVSTASPLVTASRAGLGCVKSGLASSATRPIGQLCSLLFGVQPQFRGQMRPVREPCLRIGPRSSAVSAQ